jgi:hypothetical protein
MEKVELRSCAALFFPFSIFHCPARRLAHLFAISQKLWIAEGHKFR